MERLLCPWDCSRTFLWDDLLKCPVAPRLLCPSALSKENTLRDWFADWGCHVQKPGGRCRLDAQAGAEAVVSSKVPSPLGDLHLCSQGLELAR